MVKDEKIWIANDDKGENIFILPEMANRHGLIAGATGTGKTVTLKVMAETFSDMGVPVFMADVKGAVSGMAAAGDDSENMQKRILKFGLSEMFRYKGYPVTFWDIFGEKGIQLRTTISEVGPVLLSRILELNDLQTDVMNIVFKIADDNNMLLVDTKDLKAMLNYVQDNAGEFAADYGRISPASTGAMIRSVVALEMAGGDVFFGEPALNIFDWLTTDANGKGMIHILDSSSLINNGKLYSTFLLWMISELFENLPEVGDLNKPKMVFFFDEAHLLFNDAPKALLDKIEQVVKLIRSKGVGIYFCTQNPRDIPDGVLAQLGNKVEHALRAFTPSDQKAVRAAAESFRVNPEFDTYEAIQALGTGEAVVSFLDEKGIPGMARKAFILPPQSRMGPANDSERDMAIKSSLLYSKYSQAVDSDTAYEFIQRLGLEEAANEDMVREKAANAVPRGETDIPEGMSKEEYKEYKAFLKEKEKNDKIRKRAAKSVGTTVVGTVGREVGKQMGKGLGRFGKTLGGNVGASVARGLFSTLFKA